MCNVASRLLSITTILLLVAAGCRNASDDAKSAKAEPSMTPESIEQECLKQLAEVDSMLAFAEARHYSLLQKMEHHQIDGFPDGYMVATEGYTPNFYSTTGLQGRVASSTGQFYLVSSLTGKPLQHNSVTVSTLDHEATTDVVPRDGELNMATSSGEVVTYFGSNAEAIGKQMSLEKECDNPRAVVTFHGDKGEWSITLTPEQISGIGTAWEYADNYQQLQELSIERDRLKATLDFAQSQK